MPAPGAVQTVLRALGAAGPSTATAKIADMLRPLLGLSERDLERQLLRRGVGELEADRHRCVDCGRTPLVGERVHRYARGETVCELCSPLRVADPETSQLVRHSEHGHTVRVRARLAA
jgi:hypothetical protein